MAKPPSHPCAAPGCGRPVYDASEFCLCCARDRRRGPRRGAVTPAAAVRVLLQWSADHPEETLFVRALDAAGRGAAAEILRGLLGKLEDKPNAGQRPRA